jgi:hypothetical protein
MQLLSRLRRYNGSPRGDFNARSVLSREESHVHLRPRQRPPPRKASAKPIELSRLWTVMPEQVQRKTLRCLARIVVGHLARREVHDERR